MKNMKLFLGVLTLAFILAANLQYVFSGYGIRTASTLHLNVLAQTSNGTNSGGTSSDGTNSGGTSSGSTNGTFTGNFCGDINYVPNRAITATIIDREVKTNASGELIVGDHILKTGLKKEHMYSISYELKNCNDPAEGSCCDQRRVGAKLITGA